MDSIRGAGLVEVTVRNPRAEGERATERDRTTDRSDRETRRCET
ncbi:hypothetical protein [Halorussus salinus]|nr:hypothetical protein [Halorussus salinus]